MAKLFIEIRVWLNPNTALGMVNEAAEGLKDRIYDMVDEEQSPVRACVRDVTYMVKHEEERRKI